MITDHNRQVLERHDYMPFGQEWLTSGTDPRLFAGKERDGENRLTNTGLDYFGGRYFSSDTGRFTTVDPGLNVNASLLQPQRWNRYAYALNNPVTQVDPDGREVPVRVGGHLVGLGLEAVQTSESGANKVLIGFAGILTGSIFGAGTIAPAITAGINWAAACFFSPSCQATVLGTMEGLSGGPSSGQLANELGVSRELAAAEFIGGSRPERTLMIYGASSSTNVDVLGPAGEYVLVGGPAKGLRLSEFGQEIAVYKDAAGKARTRALAVFTDTTPEWVLEFARKRLGRENVFVMPEKR